MQPQEILGLDVGDKHIGVARASTIAKIAEPLLATTQSDIIGELKQYINEHQVEAVVVGLPRNLSGDETEQTAAVRGWVDLAKQEIKTTFYWQDEALTSKEAIKAQASKFKGQSVDEHSISAALILQDFLDAPEGARKVA